MTYSHKFRDYPCSSLLKFITNYLGQHTIISQTDLDGVCKWPVTARVPRYLWSLHHSTMISSDTFYLCVNQS
jgi:hypothetical protein